MIILRYCLVTCIFLVVVVRLFSSCFGIATYSYGLISEIIKCLSYSYGLFFVLIYY